MTPPKKYKWYWDFNNIFGESQAVVVQIQHYVDAAFATIITTTWATVDVDHAAIIGIAAIVTNKLVGGLYREELP